MRIRVGGGAGLAKSGGLQWSAVPLKITSVEGGNETPVTYTVEDAQGNNVPTAQDGRWGQGELLAWVPTQLPADGDPTYILRNIIRPVDGGKYLVSWVGYGQRDNTEEPREKLMEDVPSWVISFEAKHSVKWNGNKFTWVEKPVAVLPKTKATAAAAGKAAV